MTYIVWSFMAPVYSFFSLAFIYRQLGTCRCVRMSSQSSYNYPVRRCQDIDIKVCIHLCGRENHHIQLIAKKAITMAKKRASGEGNIRKRKDSRWVVEDGKFKVAMECAYAGTAWMTLTGFCDMKFQSIFV